jgi:hypothetical protein
MSGFLIGFFRMKADSRIEAIHGCKFKEMIKDTVQNAISLIHVCYFL